MHISRVTCAHTISLVVLQTELKNKCDHSHFSQFQIAASTARIQQVPFSFSKCRSLVYILMNRYLLFKFALPFSLARTYKRLVRLTGVSRDFAGILKCFYALFLPLRTFSRCLVHAMPPQSTKIEHLPRDASAILRERYLAGTFSVTTQ